MKERRFIFMGSIFSGLFCFGCVVDRRAHAWKVPQWQMLVTRRRYPRRWASGWAASSAAAAMSWPTGSSRIAALRASSRGLM